MWVSAPPEPHPEPSTHPSRGQRSPCVEDCRHLVVLGPWATGHTGLCTVRLVSFQDGVRGTEVAGSRISVNVMTSRTGGAGGAQVRGFQGTGTAVGGHATHDIGDIDGVDLGNVIGVLSALEMRKQKQRKGRPETAVDTEIAEIRFLFLLYLLVFTCLYVYVNVHTHM